MSPIPIVLALVGAASAVSGLNSVTAAGGGLQTQLQAVGEAGGELRSVGSEVLALGNEFSEAFIKVDRLSGKMQTLLDSKGVGDAKDQIQELADALEVASGEDADAIGLAISKAVATGKTKSLAAYGIVLSETAQQAIKAAGDISETAKAQETLNQVMEAGGAAVKTIGDSVSDSSKTIAEMGVRWGNFTETMGEGSSEVRAAVIRNVLFPILDVIEASPGLQKTAGGLLEIGGVALSTGGFVLQMGSQVGLLIVSLQTMGITSVASFGSYITGALSSVGASLASGAAAISASIGFGALAASVTLATAAVAGLLVAYLGYQDAQTMDDEHLKQKWGPLADVWIGLSGGDGGADVDHTPVKTESERKIDDITAKAESAMSSMSSPKTIALTPSFSVPAFSRPEPSGADEEDEEEGDEEEHEATAKAPKAKKEKKPKKEKAESTASPSMAGPKTKALETAFPVPTSATSGEVSSPSLLARLRNGATVFDSFGTSKVSEEKKETPTAKGPSAPATASVTLKQGEEKTLPNGDILVKVAGEVLVKNPLKQLGAALG